MTTPARIYLQPECCADPDVGRLWSETDEPEACRCDIYDPGKERGTWTEYVRADLVLATDTRPGAQP